MVKTLVWGVKQSFRGYVEAMGTIEAGAGATRTEDGAFAFAAAPDSDLTIGADGRPTGRGVFLGEVRFDAHGGMLKVFLADPILEFGPDGAKFTVADSADRKRRIEIAALDLDAASEAEGELAFPSAITLDGYFLLGDHYPPKTPLDPVRLAKG